MFRVIAFCLFAVIAGSSQSSEFSWQDLSSQVNGYAPATLDVVDAAHIYGVTSQGGSNYRGTVWEMAFDTGQWIYSTIYTFDGIVGGYPEAGVTYANGRLYGTSVLPTTIFSVTKTTNGWTYNTVYSYPTFVVPPSYGPLLFNKADGMLYGTSSNDGLYGGGTIYRLNLQSSNPTPQVLYNFTGGDDGFYPTVSLNSRGVIEDRAGNLYGITTSGTGSSYAGTIFEITPRTWKLTTLHDFVEQNYIPERPAGNLLLDDAGNLYGVTTTGGANYVGGVYELTTARNYIVLYSFPGGKAGQNPMGGLQWGPNGTLLGTTIGGGDTSCYLGYGCGVLFQLTPTVSGEWHEDVLHTFTWDEGDGPVGAVMPDNQGNYFGVTQGGGDFFKFRP